MALPLILPTPAHALLHTFAQLTPPLVTVPRRALREDRTLIAAADLIASTLGQRFVESVPLNMERAWAESRPTTPLICLLSPGARPLRGGGARGLLAWPGALRPGHVGPPLL